MDLEIADAVLACDEGLLEFIEGVDLPAGPDGTPAARDFPPDTLTECSVGTNFYSTIFAYNRENFSGGEPATIEDFFDMKKFPGRRGMRRTPQVNLEFALMADGVPLDQVYATLSTEEGVDRAFRKLDTIKEHIVWWTAGAQPPQMLADGEVVMSTAYNGRIFNAQVLENQPFTVVWDGQVLDKGATGHRLRDAEAESRTKIPCLCGKIRVHGPTWPLYLLQSRPAVRISIDHDSHRDRRRHEATHADQSGEHDPRPAQRLGMVERSRGRNERAVQRMDGTLRKVRLRAAVPVVPLAAFILVTFIAPLATMLVRSVYDPLVAEAMPETLLLLSEWDGKSIPREAVFEAAVGELLEARQARNLGRIVTRINRVQPGMRSVIMKSVRRLRRISGSDSWRDTLIDMDPAWGKAQTWRAIRRTGERFTMRHYLHAVDLDRGPGGGIVRQEPERRIYIPLLGRTLAVSLSITALCLLLGYPVAYLIANAPARWANLLLLLVLVPFWTSLLVRTTSWIVLLQTRGVINDALVALGLIAEENRIAMIYNMTGTVVAMTHVLLPYMVLPLYSVMRTIPPLYMNAAATLGASFPRAFRRVYPAPGRSPACLPDHCSCSSWPSGTTSLPNWWADAAGNSSPT